MKCLPLFWLSLALVSLAVQPASAQPFAFTNFAGLPRTSGTADGTGSAARFNQTAGIAVGAAGSLFVGDQNNHTIRKITPAGVVTTFAGAAGQAGYVDGPVAIARFNEPYFLAFDAAGNLYVSELGNHTIRKITPEGVVSTFAGGGGQFNRPIGLAFDAADNLYVADSAQHAIRIVTPGGLVLTLAGALGNSGSNDGSATTARFYFPVGLALDAEGNIFVSDAGNDTVRKISSNGVVTTLAGAPGQKADTDGSGSVARFYQPSGICLAADGNLIVADPGNSTIRRITPAGVVTTIAGLARQAGTADGIGAAARFFNPGYVAFDAAGALFVSDPFNHRISRATSVIGFPQLTTVPTNQTFGPQGTTLSVTATGTPPLAYQWQLNGTNLPNANDATFAIAGNATGAGRYTVTVTNVLGAATSAEALLLFFDGLRFHAGMSLTGVVGRQYRVDFADIAGGVTNWVALTNLTLTANPVMVIDPTSAGLTNRSYRAVLLP